MIPNPYSIEVEVNKWDDRAEIMLLPPDSDIGHYSEDEWLEGYRWVAGIISMVAISVCGCMRRDGLPVKISGDVAPGVEMYVCIDVPREAGKLKPDTAKWLKVTRRALAEAVANEFGNRVCCAGIGPCRRTLAANERPAVPALPSATGLRPASTPSATRERNRHA